MKFRFQRRRNFDPCVKIVKEVEDWRQDFRKLINIKSAYNLIRNNFAGEENEAVLGSVLHFPQNTECPIVVSYFFRTNQPKTISIKCIILW
jgi:hypothetical protein